MATSSFGILSGTRWHWPALRLTRGDRLRYTGLALLVALAVGLRFANLDAIGQSNTYYTAAVKSMLQSWHNFFFVAAEPGGSVSVDKPPVGLWLQAISAYFLGVNGFAVVLPQLLAGVGSVILLYHLVRRWFGTAAGLLAGLVLAVTPVVIAVERNNTPDATLIFALLLATWAFIKATETRRLRFLLLGAVLVGIGFNIKMMQAFLPLPALYAMYFFGTQQSWRRKLAHLALTSVLIATVSLSWAVAVDLTPASQRPYVGSSTTNSELNLIFGYNGLQRLLGRFGQGNSVASTTAAAATSISTTSAADNSLALATNSGSNQTGGQFGNQPPAGFGPDGGQGGPSGNASGGMFGTGTAGVLRLFQSGLAAQASWLLPFGLLLLAGLAFSRSWRRPHTELHRGLMLWGGWLVTAAAFFSVAGFFHQYYLSMLGAPLAALVGVGIVSLWRLRQAHPVRAALLLIGAAGITLAYQVYAVAMYQSSGWWLAAPIALAAIGAALLLANLRWPWPALARAAFVVLAVAMLVVPTVWSGLTVAYNSSQTLPQAYGNTSSGPSSGASTNWTVSSLIQTLVAGSQSQMTQVAAGSLDQGVNQSLLSYLEANTQNNKYLLVVSSSQQGAGYVLATGRPVLYAGGFSGSDAVIDGTSLAALVAKGDVRYVLWGGGGPSGTDTSISSYLQSACIVVSSASLGTNTTSHATTRSFGGGPGGQGTLYQCGA